MNLSKHPILKQAYDVMQAIEECGASPALTKAVTMMGSLAEEIDKLVDVILASKDETGWLVENGKSGSELRYRTIDEFGRTIWTDDHMKALRFARREDAELFAKEDEEAWRIEEHMWTGDVPRVLP